MQKVNDGVSNPNNYANDYREFNNSCSPVELQKTFSFIKQEYPTIESQFEYAKCHKFITVKGTFYDVYPGMPCWEMLLLERESSNLEFVIKKGSNREVDAYPCNNFAVYRINEDGINITFSGFENPSKALRLTIN